MSHNLSPLLGDYPRGADWAFVVALLVLLIWSFYLSWWEYRRRFGYQILLIQRYDAIGVAHITPVFVGTLRACKARWHQYVEAADAWRLQGHRIDSVEISRWGTSTFAHEFADYAEDSHA